MRVLRVKQVFNGQQGTYDLRTIIHLDDRGTEAPGARCLIILKEERMHSVFNTSGDEIVLAHFVIDGSKYTGWFQQVEPNHFVVTQIFSSSLPPTLAHPLRS